MFKHLPAFAVIAAAVTTIILATITFIALDPGHRQARIDAARYAAQRQELELQQRQWELQQVQLQASAVAPITTITGAVWRVLPLLAAGLALLALADAWHLRRRIVTVDAAGRLPLPRQVVEVDAGPALAALGAYHTTEYARVRPRMTMRDLPPGGNPDSVPAPAADTSSNVLTSVLPMAPTFAQLRARGWRPTSQRMLLGFSAEGPIYGGIDALLSTAIAGRPGQGKTTALRFVCAQTLLAGGETVILDPHGSIAEAIAGAPARLMASSTAELGNAAAWLNDELDRRDVAYRAGERLFTPLLVLCDEWPLIGLKSKQAVEAGGRVVLEGRKWGVYALISGQGLPADRFGGSLVRDALSSRYVFRTTPAQARIAGLDKDAAQLVNLLEPGRAVLDGPTVAPVIVAIPNTTANDLVALYPLPATTGDEALLSTTPERPEGATSALECAKLPLPAEDAEILELPPRATLPAAPVAVADDERAAILAAAAKGASRREICRRVFDGATGGAAYRKVQAVLDQAELPRSATDAQQHMRKLI
ncbi:MAG TPA: hypothetical protein VLA19_16005 [Herpetosiphonaceae bacterium]|nr:hypothetical protein [Herpetosiphonaceae bacterium]